ncbi:hypothetical protein E2C01_016824 [Portunus trituberculatus]|uniref:Uncharacterized protein n=1 Tax=Portunus trituberculatus TaxID=210409 RepID=A0A5B7DQ44_PORTR|nr:hypothetical protein [Portunus trituberculatus]
MDCKRRSAESLGLGAPVKIHSAPSQEVKSRSWSAASRRQRWQVKVWREAAGAQAGCSSGEMRNQLEERRGVHRGAVCWCLSWAQNLPTIVTSEKAEPRPVAKPRGTEASWWEEPRPVANRRSKT